jgi:ribosomal protein S18 acetylase RimI-like enzyme
VRNAQIPGDIAGWLGVREAAFADIEPRPGLWTSDDFWRELCPDGATGSAQIWLAETTERTDVVEMRHSSGRNLSGSVAMRVRDEGGIRSAHVHWLLVHPRFRRRGVGRTLMTTLERACWEAGFRRVSLETHRNWEAAVAFYRSLGYG